MYIDIQKIENLKDQVSAMKNTEVNLSEASQALCKITIEIANAFNKLLRKIDDKDEYQMEQRERE